VAIHSFVSFASTELGGVSSSQGGRQSSSSRANECCGTHYFIQQTFYKKLSMHSTINKHYRWMWFV